MMLTLATQFILRPNTCGICLVRSGLLRSGLTCGWDCVYRRLSGNVDAFEQGSVNLWPDFGQVNPLPH